MSPSWRPDHPLGPMCPLSSLSRAPTRHPQGCPWRRWPWQGGQPPDATPLKVRGHLFERNFDSLACFPDPTIDWMGEWWKGFDCVPNDQHILFSLPNAHFQCFSTWPVNEWYQIRPTAPRIRVEMRKCTSFVFDEMFLQFLMGRFELVWIASQDRSESPGKNALTPVQTLAAASCRCGVFATAPSGFLDGFKVSVSFLWNFRDFRQNAHLSNIRNLFGFTPQVV